TGQELAPDALETLLTKSLAKTWARHAPEGDGKTVSRWVVKMVNEQIGQSVAAVNGIVMDPIAFRHAVSLLNDLHVCFSTRAVAGRQGGWTIWLTADGEAPNATESDLSPAGLALARAPWIKRRVPPDNDLIQAIVEAVLDDPQKAGGFSLI